MDNQELDSKVVVIMGASSGIGAATAEVLAQAGAKLMLSARHEDKLQDLQSKLGASNVAYKVADVRNRNEVKAVVDETIAKFGKIDAIYNNAGIMPLNPLEKLPFQEWQDMLDINIMGVLNGIAAVLPIMKQQGFGQIIATDSVAGHVVLPTSAVYDGTKFAVRAIMEGLRLEEKGNGIRSTIISPGLVDTNLYKNVADKSTQDYLKQKAKITGQGLSPYTIANTVKFALEQPEGTTISEILIRPTEQDD